MHIPSRQAPVLRGRGREREAIDALLARAAAGNGGALLLQGGPGLGKTALLEYAAHAATDQLLMLATNGVADELRLPYAALQRLLHPILNRLTALPAPQASLLTRALTGAPTESNREPPRNPSAGPLGFARASAVLALLAVAATRQPLLCCVDDLERLDPASRKAITFVARRLAGQPVALIATTAVAMPEAEPTEAAIAGITAHRIPPLAPAASAALLADLTPVRLPDRVARPLVRLAGGNPQALRELLESLTEAQRAGAAAAPTSLPADSTLRHRCQRRLRRLPGDTRWLLLLAAAGGPDLTTCCLAEAARRAGVDVVALGPAEHAGLIRVTDRTVDFPQPLLRTLVYEAAPLGQRRDAHRQLGEAAAAIGDYRLAATAAAQAAELTSGSDEAARRLLAAAGYAWQAGAPEQARQLLHRVGPGVASDLAGHRRLLHGEIELRTGVAGTALSSLLSAAAALQTHRRDLAVRALVKAVEAAWFTGDHRHYPEIAARAAALRASGSSGAQAQMLAYVAGYTALFLGQRPGAESALRQVIRLVGPPDAGTDGQRDGMVSLVLAAGAAVFVGDFQRAAQLARRVVTAAGCGGHSAPLPLALELLALAELAVGRYDSAQAASRAGLRAARTSGQPGYAADHQGLLAVVAAIRGDYEECRRWLTEPRAPAAAGPGSRPAALQQWALAVRDLGSGRAEEAAARLCAVGDPSTGQGQVLVQILAAPWLAEAVAAAGQDRQLARLAVAGFARWSKHADAALLRALAARCRALIAPPGDPSALAHFQTALSLHQVGECDFERARTQLLFGQELRRRQRTAEARQQLQRAREAFQELGLPRWAERAAAELHPANGQSSALAPDPATGPDLLTGQQRRIAQLVARGATNREVAAQLFISPRTVDHHLRNVFQRLGIRSRVELARLLR